MSEGRCGTGSTISADKLVGKAKELLHEGNRRHVRIQHRGRPVVDLPLTAVAVGAVIAPVAAGLGVLAALATDCSISVEREAETAAQAATLEVSES